VFGELSAAVSLVRAALSGRAQCGVDCLRLQVESPPHLVAGVRRVAGDLGSTCSPAGVVGDLRGGDVVLAHVPEDQARLYGRAASVVADADGDPWACSAAYVWPGEAVLVLQEFQLPDCLVGERLLADVHLLSICRADRCRQFGVVRGTRAHRDTPAMAGRRYGDRESVSHRMPRPGMPGFAACECVAEQGQISPRLPADVGGAGSCSAAMNAITAVLGCQA
jgi:hypothetical protein